MGFIDYSGTKEDRYSDVLEFAEAQREEENRRLEDEYVGKSIAKIIGDASYITNDIADLIKYVIVKYRVLLQMWSRINISEADDSSISRNVLWNDMCIALITKRLEAMALPEDKRNIYFTTFVEKVFKLQEATSVEEHYQMMSNRNSYHNYFSDCFDLVQEKQFWKWMGKSGADDKTNLLEFVKVYEQLSVLTGYYLFQGIRPNNYAWLQRLEIEHKALEKLAKEYEFGRFKEPNFSKLRNPLYEELRKPDDTKSIEVYEQDVKTDDEPQRIRRPQLDRVRFEELLNNQKIIDYVEAIRLLRKCELPEEMDELYKELIIRMPILQESIDKYEKVYQPDMYQFYEYYIPEALKLTETYIEYLDVEIGEKIMQETESDVLNAVNVLLIAVNDTIDEIYKFASMEVKANAKALESMMSQDGHVNPEFKIK